MNIEIGSYDAKTKWPELLRGEPIADLIPTRASQKNDVAAAIAHMRQLMESYPPVLGIDTKALLEDGRD